MKEKFDAYVLWPLSKRVQNWIVDRSTAPNFMVSKLVSPTHHISSTVLLSTTLWSKCMFEKRLLIVEAEWLTVKSTFICKSSDEWLELETNIPRCFTHCMNKIIIKNSKKKTKASMFLQILTYTIILSVPILIRGDYTSFFTPSRLFFFKQLITILFSSTPRVHLKKNRFLLCLVFLSIN